MSSEKLLDVALDAFTNKLLELKSQISKLLLRLETEPDKVDRSSVLDHYTVIVSQLSNMSRMLRQDNMPPLRNYSLFPLALTQDIDAELEHMSEGRLRIFNHEVAPDYLRTKPEPDVEQVENQVENRVSQMQPETLQRQMNQLNTMVSKVCDQVEKCRIQMESENIDKQQQQTFSTDDTHALLAAINYGTNLKPPELSASGTTLPTGAAVPPQQSPGASSLATPNQPNPSAVNKPAPPMVKTSIKGAMPFGR